MKNTIVITTIFPPSEAIVRFSKLPEWNLLVVGDRKTPPTWEQSGVEFLSAEAQAELDFNIIQNLPCNHYCRKMVGYLYAIKMGATIIGESDDDNLPIPDWCFPAFYGSYALSTKNRNFVNVYSAFTEQFIWPRGYPLTRILDHQGRLDESDFTQTEVEVGIWQGLANGDPDVDAIYRLTINQPCNFNRRSPLVLDEGTLCPFNSQNTAFREETFPLLYLPAFVSFRFTDILRGLVAQPILWAAGYKLGFFNATVSQERNPHNYLRDFEQEYPCFLHPERVIETVSGAVSSSASVAENLFSAYEALHRDGIVEKRELALLASWLQDLETLRKTSSLSLEL